METTDGTITATVETVTPQVAQKWLGLNVHNRGMRPMVVDKYAAAMLRGEWTLNGESVKFNGLALIDGQHRLAAVVKSGVTIQTLVVRGLPSGAQDSLDHHTPRKLSDVLTLHGEKNANDLSAALTVLFRIQADAESSTLFPSVPQAFALLEREPNIRLSLPVGERIQKRIGTPRGLVSGNHYVLASIDQDDAAHYFERLGDGEGLQATSPIYVYREWCLANLRGGNVARRRPATSRIQALLVKSWNAYRRGAEIRLLKWSVGGSNPEPFPKAE